MRMRRSSRKALRFRRPRVSCGRIRLYLGKRFEVREVRLNSRIIPEAFRLRIVRRFICIRICVGAAAAPFPTFRLLVPPYFRGRMRFLKDRYRHCGRKERFRWIGMRSGLGRPVQQIR